MRRLAYLALIAALAVGGCGRTVEPPPGAGTTPPGPVPPVPDDARLTLGSSRIEMRWTVDDPAVVDEYRIYRAEGPQAELAFWEAVADTPYVDTRVVNGQEYRYEAASVIGTVEGLHSVTLFGTPGVFAISLEGGLDKTSGSNVTPGSGTIVVGLVTPGGTVAVQLTESPDPSTAPIRPLGGGSELFTLSPGDGPKTVYGRFLGQAGTASVFVSDSIVLDTKALILAVTEDSGGQPLGVNDVLHLTATVDSTGGTVVVDLTDGTNPVVSALPLFDDGTFGDPVAYDGTYERDWVVSAGLSLTNGLVLARFVDDVGNQAVPTAAPTRITISSATMRARESGRP
jgi:hypothetical protein